MASFSMSEHISAAPQRAFEVFSDVDNAWQHVSGITRIERLTDGPVGVGTRFRETRKMFKKEHTEELEFTAFDAPKHYAIGCQSCGCDYLTDFHFTPNGSGTDVRITFNYRPLTLFAKLMSPLSKLMMGSMKKCIDKDIQELKQAAESGT